MGLPNWLTILRILLIPVFVTLLVYRRAGLALLVFCLASLTDLLDGYIARSQGRQTRLGAFLDPMADKLLAHLGLRDADLAQGDPVLDHRGRREP